MVTSYHRQEDCAMAILGFRMGNDKKYPAKARICKKNLEKLT
jgi:hypothetical protein